MGRKSLIDEAYFVYYEKSLIDPNVIIARGIYAVRDYSGNYEMVETQYTVMAKYIFAQGGGQMFKRSCYYSPSGHIKTRWRKTREVYSLFNKEHIASIPTFYCRDSIAVAVKDTPFQYSAWEECTYTDLTEYFDLYSKYPCVEYLMKLGFKELIYSKLRKEYTYGAINWRGRNLCQVLRMTKQELNEIKQKQVRINFYFLKVLQIAKKQHWGFSLDELIGFTRQYNNDYYLNLYQNAANYSSPKRLFLYLKRQLEKRSQSQEEQKDRYLYTSHDVIIRYRDYLADCRKLGLDLTHDRVLFPKDLYQAHQRTIKMIKMKADKETDLKIKARVKSLQHLCFEWQGLFIRPAASFQELIDEGKALKHCVGTYAEKYADGQTTILFIRRSSKPQQPYYTVELYGQSLIQVRGLENCEPNQRVKKFLDAFESEKLRKKARKVS